MKIIIQNKKAYYNYHILEEYEAGISLLGGEIKSLRAKKGNITDAFIHPNKNEMFIHKFHIPVYDKSSSFKHNPDRVKKLLLRKSEINRLLGKVKKTGVTIVPTKVYFNKNNLLKLQIALVTGKKLFDKRKTIKEREWNRKKQQILKDSFKN